MHASARSENIYKSVFKYIEDNLANNSGPPAGFDNRTTSRQIQWPDVSFDPDKVDTFLRVTLIDGQGETFDSVATSGNSPGFLKVWTLVLDVFLRREWVRQQSSRYLLAKTLDTIKDAFALETLIEVLDYASGANSDLGDLEVVTREPNNPQDEAWVSGGWMIGLRWVEIDT